MSEGACRVLVRRAARRPAFVRVLGVGMVTLACGCAPGSETGGHGDEARSSTATQALEWTYQDRLVAFEGLGQDRLGASLALSGNKAVAGAFGSPGGQKKGAAHVFARGVSAWEEEATLTVEGAFSGDMVGAAVAIFEDTALLGAPQFSLSQDPANPNPGRAHVFTFDGASWGPPETLVAEDGTAGVGFGSAVALSDGIAVVGARRDNEKAQLGGAVHVFVKNGATWMEQAKLTASDTAVGDGFGAALALSGNTLLVGAPGKDDVTGAAYVFVWNGSTWEEQVKLPHEDGHPDDSFGRTVSLSGDRAVVGAPFGDGNDYNTGAVYVFVRANETWDLEAKLVASDGEMNDGLGLALALHEDTIAAGAELDDDQGEDAGAVYVFDRSDGSWKQRKKLVVGDGVTKDYMGRSVALSADTILSGSGEVDAKGGNSGAVYVFERRSEVGAACTEAGQCASGFCVSEVCCETECAGADMACSAAAKGAGSDGICGPVMDGSGGATSAGGASGSTSTGGGGSTGTGGGGANAGGTGGGGARAETSYYSCAAGPGLPGSGVGSFGALMAVGWAARARRRRRVSVR